jgi:hypothetical protein
MYHKYIYIVRNYYTNIRLLKIKLRTYTKNDIMDDPLKYIEKNVVDRKKVRKSIRKKFEFYETLLRLNKFKDKKKQYKSEADEIMKILFRTLDNDLTYETRNLYFLFAVMEMHFTFYKDMVERIKNVNDYSMNMAYDAIFQKNSELIKLLKDNEKEPITAEQIEQLMENQKDD